jgi:tetratricopeptide (TPR) repeat protein
MGYPNASAGRQRDMRDILTNAREAQARNDWAVAAEAWHDAILHGTGRGDTRWYLQLGRCLEELDRLPQAEAAYREARARAPDDTKIANRLLRVLLRQSLASSEGYGPRREEVVTLAKSIIQNALPAEGVRTVAALLRVSAIKEASAVLGRLIPSIADLRSAEIAQRLIPLAFEEGARVQHFQALLGVADRTDTRLLDEGEQARLSRLKATLRFAIYDYEAFAQQVDCDRRLLSTRPEFGLIEHIRRRLERPLDEIFAEPKIFGIGLSKTGTTSLAEALNLLGFLTGHLQNPLTCERLTDRDYYFLDAATDGPRQNFESLYYTYPNSRFILTIRPFESWETSIEKHFRTLFVSDTQAGDWRPYNSCLTSQRRGLAHAIDLYTHHLGKGGRRAAYDAFQQRVTHFFSNKPPGRLLTLDIFSGQGWPELCTFLHLAEPSVPFPWVNKDPARKLDAAEGS